jgi:hypothetical protein
VVCTKRALQEHPLPGRNQNQTIGGNSGLYFRTAAKPGISSDGYEAQIDSTHKDPISNRTRCIGMVPVYKQLVKPDTWFSKYDLEVRDDIWAVDGTMTRDQGHCGWQ